MYISFGVGPLTPNSLCTSFGVGPLTPNNLYTSLGVGRGERVTNCGGARFLMELAMIMRTLLPGGGFPSKGTAHPTPKDVYKLLGVRGPTLKDVYTLLGHSGENLGVLGGLDGQFHEKLNWHHSW